MPALSRALTLGALLIALAAVSAGVAMGDDDSALRDQIAMLKAEVEQLKRDIAMLMGRADISAADLAALREELEAYREQQEQRDFHTVPGLEGELARGGP